MTSIERESAIRAIVDLGKAFSRGKDDEKLCLAVETAYHRNQWFIPCFLWYAIKQWADLLTEENVRAWSDRYSLPLSSVKVGMVLAGNIPLVGLHDVLAGFLSGHHLYIKLSSQDEVMIKYVLDELKTSSPDNALRIHLVSSLQGVDAVVATGSDNTARYFEYYFRNMPSVIRHSRTSVAVVEENTTNEELSMIADDVMLYWGRGCRSISRVFFPIGFDMKRWVEALSKYTWVADYHYYRNNYDYQKAIYAMSGKKDVYDTGFVLLSVEENVFLPTGVVGYGFYDDIKMVEKFLEDNSENIQCVSSMSIKGAVLYGKTQSPSLLDYADGVDTMEFFKSLHK